MKSKRYSSNDFGWGSCLWYLVCAVVYLALCGWSVNYLLQVFSYPTIPFFWAEIVGIVAGGLTITVAVIVVLLRWLGVPI